MRTKAWILPVMIAAIALSLGGTLKDSQKDPRAEARLQAAITKETVEGDLKGAIELYRKLADGGDHAVAAKALVRMGQCYEKLGNTEARKAYERVVREFSDQKEMAANAQARLAALAAAGGTAGSPQLAVKRVLEEYVDGKVSSDGRFLTLADSDGNVAIRDLITGQKRRLTDEANWSEDRWAEEPLPSPDGASVAYAWWGATRELRVVGLDGSKPRVLRTGGNGVVYQSLVDWSPDSRSLLAEIQKTDGSRDMVLVAVADGSTKLLKALGRNPSPGGVFSPDERYIAWATEEGISLFELKTGAETLLIPDRTNPRVLDWAPDGRHILFSSERSGSADAWLIAVADGKARGEPLFVRKNWGSWPLGFTPSGAFYYGVSNNIWDVQIAELNPAGGQVATPSRRAFRRGNTRTPDWSPDGRSIAAVDARQPSRAVIVRSMDTGEERELEVGERTIEMGHLRWTPDGRAVVVPASEPGKGQTLIRIDVQTGQVTSLMPLPGLSGMPRFELSRDGHVVFYLRPGGIVAHDLRTGQETVIVDKQGLVLGAISPDGQGVAVTINPDNSRSLLVMPASGGEFQELVRIDNEKETPLYGIPSLTSDFRAIVYLKMTKKDVLERYELWRVSVEGGEPQRIGTVSARRLVGIRLHPDGRRVAIMDLKIHHEVWVMENFLPPAKAAK
jgi:Tol biopolymer transport system component